MLRRLWSAALDALAARVDPASLVVFRVCWGGLMFWHVLEYFLTERLQRQYIDPVFHFSYPGFSWVQPLPAVAMKLLFLGMLVAALGIAAGAFYRFCAAYFFVGITYLFLLDAAFYQNHFYLICLISFWVWRLPLHRAGSVDARRRPELAMATLPASALWMLRFHIAVPYFFGGVAKLNADWLLRAQPLKLWLSEGLDKKLQVDWLLEVLKAPSVAYGMAWAGAAFDLAVVPLLLWRRTRLAAFVAALVFHTLNNTLFQIGVFPFFMAAASLLFFDPDWPRRWWKADQKKTGQKKKQKTSVAVAPEAPPSRLAVRLTVVYLVVQLLLPFRHFLIPGNVDWTEEGHRFAWRMKLRDKRGDLRFVAHDPTTGNSVPMSNTALLLTSYQHRMMGHDPDLIRQFAAFLARRLRQEGSPASRVRASTQIAWNGRPPAPQIDPAVDLSQEPWRWGAAPWILPAPKP